MGRNATKIEERLRERRARVAAADAVLVSFPKSGRTMVRYFLAAYREQRDSGSLQIESRAWPPGSRVVFTHDFFDVHQDTDEPVRVLFADELAPKRLLLLVRDPRDTAVSYYYHKRFRQGVPLKSVQEAILSPRYGIERQSRHVLQLLDLLGRGSPEHLVLSYEMITADRERQLARIAGHLFGEPADPSALAHALAASSFAAMRRLDEDLTRSGTFLGECLGLPSRASAQRVEEDCLKVRRGKVGGWRDELDLWTRLRIAFLPETRRLLAHLRRRGLLPDGRTASSRKMLTGGAGSGEGRRVPGTAPVDEDEGPRHSGDPDLAACRSRVLQIARAETMGRGEAAVIAAALGRLLSCDAVAERAADYAGLARHLWRHRQAEQALEVARALFLATGDERHLALVGKSFGTLHAERLRAAGVASEADLLAAIGGEPLQPVLERAGTETVRRVLLPVIAAGMREHVTGALAGEQAAAENLVRLLSDMAHDAAGLVSLGEAYLRLRRSGEAYRCALDALRREPDSLPANELLFRLYPRRREHAAAVDRLSGLCSRRVFPPAELAELAMLSGQEERARSILSAQLAREPGDERARDLHLRLLDAVDDLPALREIFGERRHEGLNPFALTVRRNLEAVDVACRHDAGEVPADCGRRDLLIAEIFRRARFEPSAQRRPAGRRVALVVDTLGPGGAERQAVTLARALAGCHRQRLEGVRVYVANRGKGERDTFHAHHLVGAGVEVADYCDLRIRSTVRDSLAGPRLAELYALLRPPALANRVMQLVNHLVSYDPDIVYAMLNDQMFFCGLAGAALPTARVVGRWGSMPRDERQAQSAREVREARQLRRAFRAIRQGNPTMRFLANAATTAEAHRAWLGWEEGAVETVHNGVDFSCLQPSGDARRALRRELGIPEAAVVLGGVLRMSAEKRPLLWVELAQRIAARADRPLAFVLVGDGPLLHPVREAAAAQTTALIRVVGRKENVADFYAAMDALLVTSCVEGLSNAVLEAQSQRLPVISFDVGGLAEAIADGKTGFLVEEGDLRAYVDKACLLVGNADRRREMAEAAAAFVAENFSVAALLRNTTRVFGWS